LHTRTALHNLRVAYDPPRGGPWLRAAHTAPQPPHQPTTGWRSTPHCPPRTPYHGVTCTIMRGTHLAAAHQGVQLEVCTCRVSRKVRCPQVRQYTGRSVGWPHPLQTLERPAHLWHLSVWHEFTPLALPQLWLPCTSTQGENRRADVPCTCVDSDGEGRHQPSQVRRRDQLTLQRIPL
jgi:hypothetical protein